MGMSTRDAGPTHCRAYSDYKNRCPQLILIVFCVAPCLWALYRLCCRPLLLGTSGDQNSLLVNTLSGRPGAVFHAFLYQADDCSSLVLVADRLLMFLYLQDERQHCVVTSVNGSVTHVVELAGRVAEAWHTPWLRVLACDPSHKLNPSCYACAYAEPGD